MNSTRRYMIAGMLALTPLWITWLVLSFLFGLLAQFGKPLVLGMARVVQGSAPSLSQVLLNPWFESVLAVLAMLIIIYSLGWTTTHVLGARLLTWFDRAIDRIPLAKTVYSSTKKMLAALQAQPEGTQRVVFISFPSRDMKTIGLVTRTERPNTARLIRILGPWSWLKKQARHPMISWTNSSGLQFAGEAKSCLSRIRLWLADEVAALFRYAV